MDKKLNLIEQAAVSIFNDPTVGLFYTQQHIHNTFPILLSNMDKLSENRKKLNDTIKSINSTDKEISELITLNDDYSFRLLTKLSGINYELNKK